MSRRRLRVEAEKPGILEIIIVVALAILAIGLALGLHVWIPLAVIGAFVANGLGYNPWLGVGIVGLVFLFRLAWGK